MNEIIDNMIVFEAIKHLDEFGNEYWEARELQKALEYKEWRKFEGVISKAIKACNGSNMKILEHFVGADKVLMVGNNTKMKIINYKLSDIRKFIKKQGGTMPENLLIPNKSLKEIEKDNTRYLIK